MKSEEIEKENSGGEKKKRKGKKDSGNEKNPAKKNRATDT